MPPIIPDEVPERIAAGTTVKFHRSFDDFPASDGWTYAFHMNGVGTVIHLPATINPDGQSFDVVLPANVSSISTPSVASLPAGRYTCAERLTNTGSGEVVDPSLDQIIVNVEADVSTATAGAFVSDVERDLAAVNALIANRLQSDLQSYQIAGRTVAKLDFHELRKLRGELKFKLWQLQHPGQLGPPVVIAFTNEPEQPTFPPTWVDVTGVDR